MPTVLISHAHEEKALAEAWKELLEGVTSGAVEVWFSSDISAEGGMNINTPWIDQVKSTLQRADLVIAIQSPATEGRRWILYECGYAEGLGKAVIPVVYKLEPGELPNPMSAFNVYRGDDASEVRTACAKLLESFGLKLHTVTFEAMVTRYLQQVTLHAPRRALKPQHVDQWVDRIEELVRSGRAKEVPTKRLEAYYTLTNKSPDTFHPSDLTMPLHELLSRVLLEQRCFEDCLVEANYALSIVDDDTEMLHRKALALVELGNNTEALNVIQELMRANPYFRDNPELASLEGRIYREQWQVSGDPATRDQAYDAYLRAYKADTSQHFPGINAASLALARGDWETAEAMFTQLITVCLGQPVSQTSYWSHFTVGEAQLGLGNVAEALNAYRAGLAYIPAPPPRACDSALKGIRRILAYRNLSDELPAFEALLGHTGVN